MGLFFSAIYVAETIGSIKVSFGSIAQTPGHAVQPVPKD